MKPKKILDFEHPPKLHPLKNLYIYGIIMVMWSSIRFFHSILDYSEFKNKVHGQMDEYQNCVDDHVSNLVLTFTGTAQAIYVEPYVHLL